MKKLVIILIILLFASTSFAGGLSYRDKRKLRKAGYSSSDIRKMERGSERVEPTYKYKSSTGTQYKYDLSKPDDRLKYGVDVDAQLNDNINMETNPNVNIDRNMNQYGGGVED